METKKPGLTLLGVWAHPDDEAYLSAALMHRVVHAGGRVVVVTATRGEAGFPSGPSEAGGRLREAELRGALGALGVDELRMLDHADGGCEDVDAEEAACHLSAIMAEVEPDLVVTFGPDGITGHPDHSAVSRWTMHAWSRCRAGRLLLATMTDTFVKANAELHAAIGMSMGRPLVSVPDSAVALRVQPTAVERRAKEAALNAHRSQVAALIDLLGYDTFHAWSVEETFRRPVAADFEWAAHTSKVVAGPAGGRP